MEELRANKSAILACLRRRGWRVKYPDDLKVTDAEMTEVEATLKRDGYALLWSNELQDLVGFYTDDAARQRIPACFVHYSLDESWTCCSFALRAGCPSGS